MKYRIDVTEADIRESRRGTSTQCAVARALHRTLGGWWRVEEQTIMLTCTCPLVSVQAPKKVWTFVGRYDERRSVKPFSFTLDLPAEAPCKR